MDDIADSDTKNPMADTDTIREITNFDWDLL